MGNTKSKVKPELKVWEWSKVVKSEDQEKAPVQVLNPCLECDCMYPCSAARSIKPWD